MGLALLPWYTQTGRFIVVYTHSGRGMEPSGMRRCAFSLKWPLLEWFTRECMCFLLFFLQNLSVFVFFFGFVLGTDFDLEKFFFFCTVDQICQFGRFGQTMSKTMPNIFLEWVSAQNFKKGLEVDFWWSKFLEITHLPGSSCFSVIKNNFFLEFSITQKFSLTTVNGGINLKEIFNEY